MTLDLGQHHLIQLELPADHQPPALHEQLELTIRRVHPSATTTTCNP